MRAGGLKDAAELGWSGERVARGEGVDRAGLLVRKGKALAGPAWEREEVVWARGEGEKGPGLGWVRFGLGLSLGFLFYFFSYF